MPKDIYKITNFQSGINSSGDPRDIEDTYSVEMSGLTASSAGRLKVHGGLDYYSVTKAYTTVTGASGSQSVLIPTASIQTDGSNLYIEHDGTNDLGGGGLFYFVEDYDLTTLNPADWTTVDSSFKDKGVEYFLIHNAGYLRLISIVHNNDGTQTANKIAFNSANVIQDGIKGIYYHRIVVSSGNSDLDDIDYTTTANLSGLWTGALDGRYLHATTTHWCGGDVNRSKGAVRFFQQGGLVRYVNSKPTTLSRYGQGHSHYVGAIKHDGVLCSLYPASVGDSVPAWGTEMTDGYQAELAPSGNFSSGDSVPDKGFYRGIFDGTVGNFCKRNSFFTGEAAPILRPRVYSYGHAALTGASTTFEVRMGASTYLPISSTNLHSTSHPGGIPIGDNNIFLGTHIDSWDTLKDYPTRSQSSLSVWQGDNTVVDADLTLDIIGIWEFGMSAVYHDGQETNIVAGTRLVQTSSNETFFEKAVVNTDDWNSNDGGAAPIRFAIHLLGWPFLDSERISKYRYYMRDEGAEEWYNFAEVDLTTGMLNTFSCKSRSENYESSQKLIPYLDSSEGGNGIVMYRSSTWIIAGLPSLTYEDYNGHNSSGSWVSTDINYYEGNTTAVNIPTDNEYNGIGLQEENVKFWGHWKTAALYQNRVFYGNVTTPDGVEREDTMIHSPEQQFDKMPFDGFHWVNVATGDGDKIVHLDSYGRHLLQFKRKNTYALHYDENQDLVVDKTFTGLGISHPCQVCHTPNGLVWITAQGCFLFRDGNIENLIANKIATGNQYIPFPNDASTEFDLDNTEMWYSSTNRYSAPTWWYVTSVTDEDGVTTHPDRNWDINAVDYIHHGWKGFFLPSIDIGIESSRPFVGYDAAEDILIVGRSTNYQTDFLSNARGAGGIGKTFSGQNDGYMYNFKTASWNFSKHLFTSYKNEEKEVIPTYILTGASDFMDGKYLREDASEARIAHTKTNPVLTRDGKFAMGMNQLSTSYNANLCTQDFLNIMAWDPSPYKCSPLARGMGCVITKDIDFGFPGVRKKIYKVYITYRYPNVSALWKTTTDYTPKNWPKVTYFVNGKRTFPAGDETTVDGNLVGYFGQNYYNGALKMEGVVNASADNAKLMGKDHNDWVTAEVEPADMSDADNIYSFQLMISALWLKDGLKPGGNFRGFPPGFEIADIAIVYRRKPIK